MHKVDDDPSHQDVVQREHLQTHTHNMHKVDRETRTGPGARGLDSGGVQGQGPAGGFRWAKPPQDKNEYYDIQALFFKTVWGPLLALLLKVTLI